jgi:hypothetical protein
VLCPIVGYLSNRTPAASEFKAGECILKQLIRTTKAKSLIAVGEKSYTILKELNLKVMKVRHPANGGAKKYRQQFSDILKRCKR